MRRVAVILAPPAVFVLATVAAWLAGNDANRPERQDLPGRTRHAIRTERIEAMEGLAGLEQEFFLDTAKPAEVHDAAGMEAMLVADGDFPVTCGSGMGGVEYASRWAEDAPEEMRAWLTRGGSASLGESSQRPFYAYILFSQWAKDHLIAALPAALAIGNPDLRGQALISCIEVLAKTDPGRARELLLENIELFGAERRVPTFETHESAKTTCEMLFSLPPSVARTRMLAALFDSTFGGNEAQTAWAAMPESLQEELVAAGFRGNWSFEGAGDLLRERAEATGDPEAAGKFLNDYGPDWARKDLPAAFEWTQTHLKGRDRVERGAYLFRDAAKENFDITAMMWRELPDGVFKDRGAKSIAEGAPADRKSEAEALVESLSSRDHK